MSIFNDSEPLQAEYRRIGETYEPTVYDQHYKQKLREISQDPGKKESIQSMTRLKLSENEEYITYIHSWEGRNPIGSYVHVTEACPVGIYPEFHEVNERYVKEDNTFGTRVVSKNPVVSYFIPFTKEKADELHKLCNDGKRDRISNRTKYYIKTDGGTTITIDSYEDWRNGSFDELEEYGHIPTAEELGTESNQQQTTVITKHDNKRPKAE